MSVIGDFMSETSEILQPVAVNKPQLQAAVDAAAAWYVAAKVSFNNALPEPAKTNLTAPQKARILLLIAKEDFGDGNG
jgi:hypothetical protein